MPTTLFSISPTMLLVASTIVALLSAGVGILLVAPGRGAGKIIPLGAGVLVGISLFGVLPELSERSGWTSGFLLMGGGVAFMWLIGRFIYPFCPACSHTHDHGHCNVELHGFATPLVAAAVLHSLMDGFGIAASVHNGSAELGLTVALGVALHKIPEGLAYGTILRAALRSRRAAFGWCVVTQLPTLLGGTLEYMVTPLLGADWISYPLALAAGSFLYLGFHAIHGEWRQRGTGPAFMPALTGVAGAAALQHGLHFLLR